MDGSIDELLARAILDLEQKMKHEIRQNNAVLLSKMEKHYKQMDTRQSYIETKLEALLSRETSMGHRSSHHHHHDQHHGSGGRQHSSAARSFFTRSSATGRSTPNRSGTVASMVSSNPVSQPYGVFGATISPLGRQHQPHHQFPSAHHGKQFGSRPKQTLGTGGNKIQIGQEKSPGEKNTWTSKVGVYTDDEGEDSEDEGSHTGSESNYSVAKPQEMQLQITEEIVGRKSEGTSSTVAVEEEDIEVVENGIKSAAVAAATATMVNARDTPGISTAAPGAVISPVMGGFGRSHRN